MPRFFGFFDGALVFGFFCAQPLLAPDLVVEIALDGVQVSKRYAGGVALRFARVRRYRADKSAAEADTIESLRALLPH